MSDPDMFASSDPIELFRAWLGEATATEPNDPNAAALATASADGTPGVRMVLVKRSDARGFSFFTNAASQKGSDLAANPRAALCFHWKSLRRQVRATGPVAPLPLAEVDQYFRSRSRRSQIGAAVSRQSRPLASREELEKAVAHFAEQHPGEVPRPQHWRGYCLQPERIEFWKDGPDRLHDRLLFVRRSAGQNPGQNVQGSNRQSAGHNGEWSKTRLYP